MFVGMPVVAPYDQCIRIFIGRRMETRNASGCRSICRANGRARIAGGVGGWDMAQSSACQALGKCRGSFPGVTTIKSRRM